MRSKTQPHRYPAPLILPAKRDDIPRLAEIYITAEERDLMTIIENMPRSVLKKLLIGILEENFDGPELRLMKAVDRESGEITALAFWWLRGYGLEEKDRVQNGLGKDNVRKKQFLFPPLMLTTPPHPTSTESVGSPLQKYLSEAFNAFEDSWMSSTKCLKLALLMTDPQYQRRGIGTALLEWGHEMADRDGVPCFLIASPAGHPLYVHVGWKVIGQTEVDLKDWAEYAKGGDMGWGVYRYYYMLRLPKDAKT